MRFLLLDVDYDILGDDLFVILYGRTDDGKRAVVLDKSYKPYFYVLPSDIEKAKAEIQEVLKREKQKVLGIDTEVRDLFGEEKRFLKLTCNLPQETQKIRDILKSLEERRGGSGSIIEEYEYQMGFYRSYLLDKNLSSFDWLEVRGKESSHPFYAEVVLEADDLRKIDGEYYKPKILAFDTEVLEEKRGERQLVMISLFGEEIKKVLTYREGDYPTYVEVLKDEATIIERFVDIVRQYDPDILAGFNSDLFDFPVLKERSQRVKVKLNDLSLDGSGISLSKRARVSSARLKGPVHLDIFVFINNILSPMLQTEVLSLDAVSSEILKDEKIEMEYSEMLKAWKEGKNLGVLASYALKDAELTFRLTETLFPQILEITKIVGQSVFDVSRMTYSQLVEWYYTRRAKEMRKIIPNQPKFEEIEKRQKETYSGGYVREPKPGLHENLAVIDFASLYPSITSTYNISVETLNCECCKEDGFKVPGLPYWFCRKRRGFESKVVEELLVERQRIKAEMKKLDKNSLEYSLLDNRQLALKTIANASYGYYAYPASKWYSKECAESITAFGRYWIREIMERATSYGFDAIYGDTDSAFLALDGEEKEKVFSFLEEMNRILPGVMRIELEGFYPRGIFIPKEIGGGAAKKRYALIDENGNLKIRGLEKVRRDWCTLSKVTQERVLRLILESKDVASAVSFVREQIRRLKNLEVEIKDLVVYEQLSKPVNEYKLLSPHVGAAKKLLERGIQVGEGSVIGFIIEKGKGSVSERAQPLEFADIKNVDIDYYISSQIVPASMRILRVLGVSEAEILL